MTYELDFANIGKSVDEKIAGLESLLAQREEELSIAEQNLTDLATQLATAQTDSARITSELATANASVTALNGQIVTLKQQVDALKATVAANAVTISAQQREIARLNAIINPPPVDPQPTGPGVVRYQDISPGSRPSATIAKAGAVKVSFPPSIIETLDFLDSAKNAGFVEGTATALLGSGIDKTVFRVKAGSSSKNGWYTDIKRSTAYAVGDVRCTLQNGFVMRCTTAGTTGATAPSAFSQVNNGGQYTIPSTVTDGTVVWTLMSNVNLSYLMLAQGAGISLLQDFTIEGTELGHVYNGLRIGMDPQNPTKPVLRRIKVKGIPGTNGGNPGETFSINAWRTPGILLEDCEVDGRNAAGATVAASLVGINSNSDVKFVRGNFHHARAGIAAWQTNNIRYEGTVVTDVASRAFAHERCGGIIVLDRVTALRVGGTHAKFDSDQSSAKVTIIDPTIDGGAPTPQNPFKVCVHDGYMTMAGKNPGNAQRKEDITLILNGVSRPDCLRIQNT